VTPPWPPPRPPNWHTPLGFLNPPPAQRGPPPQLGGGGGGGQDPLLESVPIYLRSFPRPAIKRRIWYTSTASFSADSTRTTSSFTMSDSTMVVQHESETYNFYKDRAYKVGQTRNKFIKGFLLEVIDSKNGNKVDAHCKRGLHLRSTSTGHGLYR
jgi:hypothetical protein